MIYRLEYSTTVYFTAESGATVNGISSATTRDIGEMFQARLFTLEMFVVSLMKDAAQPILTQVQHLT